MTQNSPSGGIPRKSLTSAVAEKLREKIVRGDIREGEQLRQDAIAQEFQVSRIPVREALRQLEAEGVITIVPHRGAVVSLLSCDEIEELFEMRAILEPEVLRVSIPNLTDSDFAQAANVLDTYDAALRNEGNVAEWGRLNWVFHSTLYKGAHRPQFMAVIRNINFNGERYIRLQLYLTRALERAREEHRTLLELCRKRDVEAACELLARHIRSAGKSLSRFVAEHRRKQEETSNSKGATSVSV
ncbi:MAG TPA: GntR family transcriptional regulator [Terriglobales bacterium]|nr:GntR family transcriptional regulator [Terriglobales bacterium]